MAQLLDGEAFVKWFKKEYELEKEEYGEIVEYDRWISSVDVIDDIESFTPYTTEAEIMEKAIDEFVKEIRDWQKEVYTNDRYVGELDFLFKHIYEITEQLKESE